MSDDEQTGNARKVGPLKKPTKTEAKKQLSEAEVLDSVSGDKNRAAEAIENERDAKTPRDSLISSLKRVTNEDTGAGIASDEV